KAEADVEESEGFAHLVGTEKFEDHRGGRVKDAAVAETEHDGQPLDHIRLRPRVQQGKNPEGHADYAEDHAGAAVHAVGEYSADEFSGRRGGQSDRKDQGCFLRGDMRAGEV